MTRFYNFVLLSMCCWLVITAGKAQSLQARNGMLDARSWNAENRLPLNGYWKIAGNQLLEPAQLTNQNTRDYLFPTLWNDNRSDGRGSGVATYSLTILLPEKRDDWTLQIPQVYSSFALWANGELISSAGTIGTSKETCTPQWIVRSATVPMKTDSLKIVMQVANFHHYKGGIKEPIWLGTSDTIAHHNAWAFGSNQIESAVLFLKGIIFLIIYFIKKKRVLLFFALLCLSWTVRSFFSNLYPITTIAPDFNWNWQVRIEYFTLFTTISFAGLFLHELFQSISKKSIVYSLVAVNALFFLFTLIVEPVIFTRLVSLFLFVAALMIVYAAVLVIRAVLSEQTGAWFLLASLVTGIIMFGYDIIAYQSFHYNFLFLNIGYVVMFLLTTTSLLYHLNILKSRNETKNVLTYKDFFQ